MRASLALAILIATTWAALAGGGFDIVIPGRPGVPIIINGIDASYAVVEGEWGRYRDLAPNVGHYYPSAGRVPGYGRLEIEPRGRRPQAAQSYHQSWSAQSMPQPVQPEVPYYPPPVIFAPQDGDLGMPQDFSRPRQDFRHRKHRKFPH
jgi:hypothetical protein